MLSTSRKETLLDALLPAAGTSPNFAAGPATHGLLRLAAQLVLVLAGSMLLAASAQFKMVIPFSPVPVTGQTLVVLMIGLAFVFGVQPFLWGDAIKLVVAACLMPVAWRAVKAMTGTSCNDRG